MDLEEDFPQHMCVTCFRTLRISFNFLNQYKKSREILLTQQHSIKIELFGDESEQQLDSEEENLVKFNEIKKFEEADVERTKVQNKDPVEQLKIIVVNEDNHYLESRDVISNRIIILPQEEKSHFRPLNKPLVESSVNEGFSTVVTKKVIYKGQEIRAHFKIRSNTEDVKEINNEILKNIRVIERNRSVKKNKKIKPKITARTNYETLEEVTQQLKQILNYNCSKCPELQFNQRIQDYCNHILLTHANEIFECKKCSLKDLDSDAFVEHFKLAHQFQCTCCDRNFKTKTILVAHVKRWTTKKMPCTFPGCNSTFKGKQ